MLFSLYTAKFTSNLIEFFEIIRFDAAIIRLYKAILSKNSNVLYMPPRFLAFHIPLIFALQQLRILHYAGCFDHLHIFANFANFNQFHKIKSTRNFLLNVICENKYTRNMHEIHVSRKAMETARKGK